MLMTTEHYVNKTWLFLREAHRLMQITNLEAKYSVTLEMHTVHLKSSSLGPGNQERLPSEGD